MDRNKIFGRKARESAKSAAGDVALDKFLDQKL
jgi:hypothetical protein